MALTQYLNDTRLLIHDPAGNSISDADLTNFINQARAWIAGMGKCVRVLASGNSIASVSMTAGGSGYSSATTVSVSGGLGKGAILTPTIVAGVLTAITVNLGGSNYTGVITVTITDSVGTGATATATLNTSLVTVLNQEVYLFSLVNPAVQTVPGVDSILGAMNVTVFWGSNRVALNRCTWGEFQAYYRYWNQPSAGQPWVYAQYGQGISGSIYLYQIPSGAYTMEWDCYCLPVKLVDDTTPEAIPSMWTFSVPYYAAYLYYLNSQRKEDADAMMKEYMRLMSQARAYSDPPFIPTYYG